MSTRVTRSSVRSELGTLCSTTTSPKPPLSLAPRIVGEAWEESIEWASHGAVAREAGIVPYRPPGWRIGLEGFQLLDPPLTLVAIRDAESVLRLMVSELEREHGSPVYFPIALSDRPPRPVQGYLTKLPSDFVDLFDGLKTAASHFQAQPWSPPAPPTEGVGTSYRVLQKTPRLRSGIPSL